MSTRRSEDRGGTVLGFLKEKLPDPIAGQLDKAAKGENVDVGSALGGMFGG